MLPSRDTARRLPRFFLAALAPCAFVACAVGPGGACTSASECRSELACVAVSADGASRACMASCAPGTRLCGDGSVCLESPADGLVCWFGGDHPIDDPCTGDLQCEAGTVCASGVCRQACSTEMGAAPNAVCRDTETCVALGAATTEGACIPSTSVPDSGADAGDAGVTSP